MTSNLFSLLLWLDVLHMSLRKVTCTKTYFFSVLMTHINGNQILIWSELQHSWLNLHVLSSYSMFLGMQSHNPSTQSDIVNKNPHGESSVQVVIMGMVTVEMVAWTFDHE